MTLLADLRGLIGAPTLQRLRYLESIQPQPDRDPMSWIAQICEDDPAEWLLEGVTRAVPPSRWLSLLDELQDDAYAYLSEVCWRVLGRRLIPVLIQSLATPNHQEAALRRLRSLQYDLEVYADILPAIPRLVELGRAPRQSVRSLAALVLGHCGHFDATVGETLEAMVGAISDAEVDAYDAQLDAEELLALVARGGPLLRPIGHRLRPLIMSDSMAIRAGAVLAAVGIGDATLRPDLEAALQLRPASDDLSNRIERSLLMYAVWRLGVDAEFLDAAVREAEDSIVIIARLERAFDCSAVDDRLVDALGGIAERAGWTAAACRRLGSIGPRAAPVLSSMRRPASGADGWAQYLEARWLAGLDTADALCTELEAHLAWGAWDIYVRAAPDTARWHARIRQELLEHAGAEHPPAISTALVRAPEIAAAFLPNLVGLGYDEVVYALWRALPASTFWRAIEQGASASTWP